MISIPTSRQCHSRRSLVLIQVTVRTAIKNLHTIVVEIMLVVRIAVIIAAQVIVIERAAGMNLILTEIIVETRIIIAIRVCIAILVVQGCPSSHAYACFVCMSVYTFHHDSSVLLT